MKIFIRVILIFVAIGSLLLIPDSYGIIRDLFDPDFRQMNEGDFFLHPSSIAMVIGFLALPIFLVLAVCRSIFATAAAGVVMLYAPIWIAYGVYGGTGGLSLTPSPHPQIVWFTIVGVVVCVNLLLYFNIREANGEFKIRVNHISRRSIKLLKMVTYAVAEKIKMKKRFLGVLASLVFVLLAGVYIGYYITAVQYEYTSAIHAGNESLIMLELLEENRVGKVIDNQQGKLISGFAIVDSLPRWAKVFNPGSEDHPKLKDKIELYHDLLNAVDGHFAMEVYGLSQKDLRRILKTHFSHYTVFRASQDFVDRINEGLRDDEIKTERHSE